jgi:hypothetical protein
MMEFVINGIEPRMLLGARGTGKTDVCVVMGVAYKIYLDNDYRVLVVSKSGERNASILSEIADACIANGVEFSKISAKALRVKGVIGKEQSVSQLTIGSRSFRGRHPNLVILEDVVTEDDVSEATRRQARMKYGEIVKLVMNVAIVGQPVHKNDLYGELRPLLKNMEVPHGMIPELDHDIVAMRLAGVSEESISASYHLKVRCCMA